jgi:hypothetical protein
MWLRDKNAYNEPLAPPTSFLIPRWQKVDTNYNIQKKKYPKKEKTKGQEQLAHSKQKKETKKWWWEGSV